MYKEEELICLFITLPILSFLEFRAYVVRFFSRFTLFTMFRRFVGIGLVLDLGDCIPKMSLVTMKAKLELVTS